jgi:hypothetical protein
MDSPRPPSATAPAHHSTHVCGAAGCAGCRSSLPGVLARQLLGSIDPGLHSNSWSPPCDAPPGQQLAASLVFGRHAKPPQKHHANIIGKPVAGSAAALGRSKLRVRAFNLVGRGGRAEPERHLRAWGHCKGVWAARSTAAAVARLGQAAWQWEAAVSTAGG